MLLFIGSLLSVGSQWELWQGVGVQWELRPVMALGDQRFGSALPLGAHASETPAPFADLPDGLSAEPGRANGVGQHGQDCRLAAAEKSA
jgi:hypothetical protein